MKKTIHEHGNRKDTLKIQVHLTHPLLNPIHGFIFNLCSLLLIWSTVWVLHGGAATFPVD